MRRAHAKHVNIQAKSEAFKIQPLVELCVNTKLATDLALITELLGGQKGNLQGFACFYYQDLCKKKQTLDIRNETLFYNPVCRGNPSNQRTL